MKKQMKLVIATVCIVAAFSFFINQKEDVNDLMFENIEALADGEGTSLYCFGTGSLDCNGFKVDFIISGYKMGL